MVFAGAPDGSPTGYALTTEQVRPVVEEAIARDVPVGTDVYIFESQPVQQGMLPQNRSVSVCSSISSSSVGMAMG